MPTSAWHEGHQMGGYLNPSCSECKREARQDRTLWPPMSLAVAAAQLGLDPATLRQAIARGALKAEKMGRDWFVTPVEVERYRSEHLRSAVEESAR